MLRWVRNYYNARIAGVKEQHRRYQGVCDMEDEERHDHYDAYGEDDPSIGHSLNNVVPEESILRRKHGGGGGSGSRSRLGGAMGQGEVGGNASALLDDAKAVTGSGENEMRSTALTPPTDSAIKKPPKVATTNTTATDGIKAETSNTAEAASKIIVAGSDQTMTSMTDTTAITTPTSSKAAITKRKRSTVDETSVSSCSASSTAAPARGGGGRGRSSGGIGSEKTASSSCGSGSHHRHAHRNHRSVRSSSSSRSSAIPTVSDVIVRKVLNKVRKGRNISSLRMLMSLPKGRARRSKHDDITASVVDLSVSRLGLCKCMLF